MTGARHHDKSLGQSATAIIAQVSYFRNHQEHAIQFAGYIDDLASIHVVTDDNGVYQE